MTRTCRICEHEIAKVGVMANGQCSVPGCYDRDWHWHCSRCASACTTAGCAPRTEVQAWER